MQAEGTYNREPVNVVSLNPTERQADEYALHEKRAQTWHPSVYGFGVVNL